MLQQTFDFTARPPASTRRNLVIEAGAGTGKTTAIVAEVLRLMLENETLAPERIVLVTFTEKAAGEIADRIRAALEELDQLAVGSWQLAVESTDEKAELHRQPPTANRQLTWPVGSPNPLLVIDDPEKARRAIRHHLGQIDKLRSQTIHSFCQSLLRAFPIEAELDPQFTIIEGFARSLLYGQVYDAWLDEETRVHPTPEIVAEWELLFTHVGYLFQIRDVVFSMLERRDLLADAAPDFGDLSDVEPALLDTIEIVRKCPDDAGDEHARRIFAHVRDVDPPSGSLEAWIAYFAPIASDILEANLPKHAVLKEALKVLRAGEKGRSIYERLVSHRAAMAILGLSRRFIAFLDAEKRKLGVLDFDDLLLRTLALLGDADVLARVRSQFDHIFVDEFQDTDRTQAQIIDLLARDASGAYVPGRTIVVGDPKQSIYGFRRADPETYYQMTQRLERGGAERRVITDQYRSDAPLLEAINAIFACLFPRFEHDPNVFRPEYHRLRAGKPKASRELDARLTLLQVEHEEKSERFFSEAVAIADWIAARRDGGPNDLQRFAVLFRRLTNLDDYLDTFDRRGIDYVLPPTRLFLDRRAPVDLLAVLRAIAYPFDKGAQISAARTPYFALTDDEIAEGVLSEAPAEAAGAPRVWAEFTRSIARFREASTHLTVSALADLVIDTTGIERVYDAAADGVRHLRHLEHVRSIAFEYDQTIGGSVRQFVDEIARRRADPDEMEPSLIDEARNAVRILSVHAAKGLEFDTVILPDLAFNTTNPDTMQLFAVEEPPCLVLAGRAQSISGNFRRTADGEKLKKVSSLREEAELRRLFYVAVTRAKTDVVFVTNSGEQKKNTGFLKCLTEVLGGSQELLEGPGREVRTMVIGAAAVPVAFERVGQTLLSVSGPTRQRLHDAALEAELAASPIVPADIPQPVRPATLTTGEIAAQRAGSRNRAAGILLHRVLELWDGTAPHEPLLQRLASEAAADGDAVARVRQRLATIERSPMLLRIARAETIGRELPIRFVENGAIAERRIDRLLRENGRETVIDYKSGVPDPTRVTRDREQVARYCAAITAMTGRPCGGAIWYVDLERDEVVEVAGGSEGG